MPINIRPNKRRPVLGGYTIGTNVLGVPAIVVNPVITSADLSVGTAVSGNTGTWSGSPVSFSYQWQRADTATGTWADITGATSANYTFVSGDLAKYIRRQTVATNPTGSSAATPSNVLGPVVAAATNAIDVFIFAGQSNALGSQSDTAVSYTVDANVLAYDGSSLVTYQPNVVTGREWGVQATPNWAVELEFSRRYRAANPSKKCLVFKWSAGGTQLYNSGDSGPTGGTWDWHPDSTGEFFDLLGGDLQEALTALTAQGYTPTIRMVWWFQGEQDGIDATRANAYQANETALIAAMKDPTKAWKIPPGAHIIIGQVGLVATTGATTYPPTVRGAQAAVVAADTTGTLHLLDTKDYPRGDTVHITGAAFLTLGVDLYNLYVASIGPPVIPTNVTAPVISAFNLQVGQTATGTAGTWTGSPTLYAYQWQSAATSGGTYTNISGATSATYTFVTGDITKYIRRLTTPINVAGSGTPTASNALGPIVAASAGGTDSIVPRTLGMWGGVGENFYHPTTGPAGYYVFPYWKPWFGRSTKIVVINHADDFLSNSTNSGGFVGGITFEMHQFTAQLAERPDTILLHAIPCIFKNTSEGSGVPETFASFNQAHKDALTQFANEWKTMLPGRKLFVRPMWEANNNGNYGWPWYVPGSDDTRAAAYADVYRQCIDTFATAMGGRTNVVSVFCAAEGEAYNPLMWPGDTYVDVVGFDSYTYRRPGEWDLWSTLDQVMASKFTRTGGWNFWADLARTKGKPLCIPEFAINTDEPTFVTITENWFYNLMQTDGTTPMGWFMSWWYADAAYPGWFADATLTTTFSDTTHLKYPNLAAQYKTTFGNAARWG
jgi:hypothetical protein